MGRQRHTADLIIATVQGAEVLLDKGMPIEEVLLQLARWCTCPGDRSA
jgi:hypothetical protein